MQRDRMFQVLVLGGIGLVVACGSGSSILPADAGSAVDASGEPDGGSASDAASDVYFPSELPVLIDSGMDAGADVEAGFPIEK